MASFNLLHCKLSRVYSLPTWRGLAMFSIIGASILFSITHHAAVEQWIFLWMVLLVLLHLLELNEQFRHLRVLVLRFDPPFAKEEVLIPIQLSNPGRIAAVGLWIQWEGSSDWIEVSQLSSGGTQVVYLPFYPKEAGQQRFPPVRVQLRPTSEFFKLWKVFELDQWVLILPSAIDHKIALASPVRHNGSSWNDSELSHLEWIQDPRLLSKMDQKLFQKTGRPYLRKYKNLTPEHSVALRWKELQGLALENQGEQFSFWIKTARVLEEIQQVTILVETPFFRHLQASARLPWRVLKERYAIWLNEKT